MTVPRPLPGRLLAAAVVLLLAGCGGRGTAPESRPAEEPRPDTARLLFAGDLMQHLPQVHAARRGDGFDYSSSFAWVRDRFRRADLAVVNLETTLTRTERYTGYPCFRSPVAVADALLDMGVDVAVLANNHCCDGGRDGVLTTVGELDARGIARTGLFADSLDRAQRHPLYVRAGALRFALVNYTYSTNGMPVPEGMIVNPIDTALMARDLARIDRSQVDGVIACMHWGNEYERRENASQRALAAFLRRHGVDLIVGGHPHVVQPFEADSTSVTLYSLGNFVSNQQHRFCDGGLIAEIEAVRRPGGGVTYRLETTPVWVLCPGYRIVPPEVGDTLGMPASSRERYRRFLDDTRELLAR